MFIRLKESCFRHLEKGNHKNNLLLFAIAFTYFLGECNVLINTPFRSVEHALFVSLCFVQLLLGFLLNRSPNMQRVYKYVMLSFSTVFCFAQILIFKDYPAVYQVLYFNLALSLIYLNGKLTVYVGSVSVAFTLIATGFHEAYFPYLDWRKVNIPVGLMFECTLVLWAVTRIGTRFSVILEIKNRLKSQHLQNETRIRMLENRIKSLETYAFQVERSVRDEERDRTERELYPCLVKFYASLRLQAQTLWTAREKESKLEREFVNLLIGKSQELLADYHNRLEEIAAVPLPVEFEDKIRESLASYSEYTGIPFALQMEGNAVGLPNPLRFTIMQAVQIFAIRSVMYTKPTAIDVFLEYTTNRVILTVSDNGTEDGGQQSSEVIQRLSEKVKSLNGEMQTLAFSGNGNVLTLSLPFKHAAKRKINVLIADGDPFIRNGIQMILGVEDDFVIDSLVESGHEALDYCRMNKPDVVLMDLTLPDLDGAETARRIKQQWPQVKVIILTNDQDIHSIAEAILAGADAYLLKTVKPKNLAMSIRILMDGGTLLSKHTTDLLAEQILKSRKLESLEKRIESESVMREYGLKDKEVALLELLAQGKKYKSIAAELSFTEGTVRNYLSGIYLKLDVEDREQAVEKAVTLGIIPLKNRAG